MQAHAFASQCLCRWSVEPESGLCSVSMPGHADSRTLLASSILVCVCGVPPPVTRACFGSRPTPSCVSVAVLPTCLFGVSYRRSRDLLTSLQLATKILPAYERMFGVPYPLAKLDLVAIPDFAAGAARSGF